jgi:DNA-binding NarL/FixJ family response regulator
LNRSSVYASSGVRMINILLVDDYPIMQQLLRDILQRYPDICVVGEAQNGEDAILQSRKLQPTVVIIDINLPTITGMEATRSIKRQSPRTTVIGLTAGVPDETLAAMLDAGAAAVLSKGDLLNALYPAIVKAVSSAAKPAFASASVHHKN